MNTFKRTIKVITSGCITCSTSFDCVGKIYIIKRSAYGGSFISFYVHCYQNLLTTRSLQNMFVVVSVYIQKYDWLRTPTDIQPSG